jgi:hypothetical protein
MEGEMKRQGTRPRNLVAVCLLLAAVALANCGCLVLAAGAAGGAAAGYFYVRGKLCDVYYAGFDDTWKATHTALAELAMPILKEEFQGGEGSITSRTVDGDSVQISVTALESKIPAGGPATRVCVRVATFGDHPLSNRVLDQIGFHLTPATAPAMAPLPAPSARLGVIQAGATGEPPLAAPVPTAAPAGNGSQTAPPPLLPPGPIPLDKTSPK